MEQMQIKEDAPLFSRPSSPDRKYTRTLADIPEAIPGPNAFAQQAARMDRHRLDGNAFYQQEMQKRLGTPPAAVHPALRPRSKSDPPTPPRDSLCTTFSPFINARDTVVEDSPPLKLVPSDADLAVPTLRGYIEERREQIQNLRDGSPERVAVFVPTPKIASADFAKPAAVAGRGVEQEASNVDLPSKTPKKGFFGRLKLTTNLRGTSSPSSTAPTSENVSVPHYEGNMPVKAQAILGASSPSKTRKSLGSSPPKSGIPRSPSKRKGFFSRKNGSAAEIHEPSELHLPSSAAEADQTPQSASTVTKTPQTAISDPTHYSYHGKRIVSQTTSDRGGEKEKQVNHCGVARSQSLKYFDHSIPPTPPAKNTPPDEKTKRGPTLTKPSSRVPFYEMHNGQSKEPVGMISTSGRVSPTRFGSYGHKEMPTLVTKPSVYSLHASVVPNLLEASTFEEMKARIDGLGLEGFSTPAENVRVSKLAEMYSPSMYSSDIVDRPNTVVITPQIREVTKSPNGESTHTKGSSSSGGEIAICYPELAKDPSINSLEALRGGVATKRPQGNVQHAPHVPHHGVTHSKDHNSPRPSVDSLIESSVFAHHVRNDVPAENIFDSPSSFKCPSAAPSPLHLPRTTFTPPPRSTSKLAPTEKDGQNPNPDPAPINTEGLGIHHRSSSTTATPSKRNESIFDKAPSFPAPATHTRSRSTSPQSNTPNQNNAGAIPNLDPLKPPPATRLPSPDKLDRMIDLLNRLNERNNEIGMIRDEIRATNERLDQRLAAVETLHRASPAPSYAVEDSLMNEKGVDDGHGMRVSTDVAYDFYHRVEGPESGQVSASERASTSEQMSVSEQADSDTIAELKETHTRLLEMVGGMAEKIEALEKKAGGRM